MEEVDKGCSEFCVTVGTVTWNAEMLMLLLLLLYLRTLLKVGGVAQRLNVVL